MSGLNKDHIEALELIEGGADIYDLYLARTLREVQKINPELLNILSLKELEEIHQKKYHGSEQLPYFGAILSGKGKEFLNSLKAEK